MATDVSRLRKRERQVNESLHSRRRVIALRAAPNVSERAGQRVLGQPVTRLFLLRSVLLLRQQGINRAATQTVRSEKSILTTFDAVASRFWKNMYRTNNTLSDLRWRQINSGSASPSIGNCLRFAIPLGAMLRCRTSERSKGIEAKSSSPVAKDSGKKIEGNMYASRC